MWLLRETQKYDVGGEEGKMSVEKMTFQNVKDGRPGLKDGISSRGVGNTQLTGITLLWHRQLL